MRFNPTRRGVVTGAGALAVGLSAPWIARAQTYKPEYKLSTVVGKPFPWGIAGERWGELVKEKTQGRINIKMYPGAQLVGGDQTQGVHRAAPGRDRHRGRLDDQLVAAGEGAEHLLDAVPHARLQGDRRLTGGEVGKELFEHHLHQGRRPARLGRERFPRDHQFEARDQGAGGPQGPEDPRRRLAALHRHLHGARRQPDADELGRRAAGALDRRRRRAGKPARRSSPSPSCRPSARSIVTLWGYVADPLIFVVNKQVWESCKTEDQKIRATPPSRPARTTSSSPARGSRGRSLDASRRSKASASPSRKLSARRGKAFRGATKPGLRQVEGAQIGADLVAKAEKPSSPSASRPASARGGEGPHFRAWLTSSSWSNEPDPSLGARRPADARAAADREDASPRRPWRPVPHHPRQRRRALSHQYLLRLHRGVLDRPHGGGDASGRAVATRRTARSASPGSPTRCRRGRRSAEMLADARRHRRCSASSSCWARGSSRTSGASR